MLRICSRCAALFLRLAARQRDGEGGAAAGRALDGDAPAERGGQLAADGEAEAGALAAALGGVERLEDARGVFGRDADAVVAHRQLEHAVARARRDGDV